MKRIFINGKCHIMDNNKIQMTFVQKIEKETGVRIPVQHCSNSAAMIRMPEANMDMVRPGIAMYGLWPSAAWWAGACSPCPETLFSRSQVLPVR